MTVRDCAFDDSGFAGPRTVAKFAVILPAAGQSSRFHDKNYKKPFAPLANRPVWLHSAERFVNRDDVKQTIVVISPEDREDFQLQVRANMAILGIDVVDGGAERADSVAKALARVKPDIDFVCVHDAARPCLADEWIDDDLRGGREDRRGDLRHPGGRHAETRRRRPHDRRDRLARRACGRPRRRRSSAAQLLLDAYAKRGDFVATDDAQLVERIGHAGDGRARLADQPEDHHPRRSAAGRAGAQGAAQAQARRPGPSVRRRRHVAVA